MKLSYSVKNLRRLISTPEIEMRPITILVGQNSVGKSTFLRSFPLLRQSIETKSSAPVLWYGDYVDFGDFKSAVTRKDISKIIEFEFRIQDYISGKGNRRHLYPDDYALRRRQSPLELNDLKIRFGVGLGSEGTCRKFISVEVPNTASKLRLDFKDDNPFASKITLNELDLTEEFSDYDFYFSPDSLFSESLIVREMKTENESRFRTAHKYTAFRSIIEKALQKRVDNRISTSRITSEAARILRHRLINEKSLDRLVLANTKTFQNLYKDLQSGKRSQLKTSLDSICQVNFLLDVLDTISGDLSSFFGSVEYIGPARARSERFYRQQELEVSEISPDGKNLPMFLASLNYAQLKSFSSWVENTFGYGVSVHKTEGHISINLDQNGQSVNVVDTGYGVSQILPVLAQIWWMQQSNTRPVSNRFNNSFNVKTLAIEQPELHLHPAHQALLADVFAESINPKNKSTTGSNQKFIIETHSEALINRLGELIENGSVSEKDVQIVVFSDPLGEESETHVAIAEYTKGGVLKNWPFGFFNYG